MKLAKADRAWILRQAEMFIKTHQRKQHLYKQTPITLSSQQKPRADREAAFAPGADPVGAVGWPAPPRHTADD